MLGSEWGSWLGGKFVVFRESAGHWAVRVALCIHAVCFVYSFYQYYRCHCSLHLLFLLNCPYSDPRVLPFFFPLFSPPHQGEGQQSDREILCW